MIPAPASSTLHLGPIQLHLYGLIIGIAIIVALQVYERTLEVVGQPRELAVRIAIPAVICGLIGARLYHVASRPGYYASHPLESLQIWNGGLGIWGGVAAGVIAACIVARRAGAPILTVLDAGAPTVVIAQAIGRWGNYVNQELFGKPTNLPWALHVDPSMRPPGYEHFATFHPTFLYESLMNLAIGIALIVVLTRARRPAPGVVFAMYVALYTFGRFWVERLRIDPAHTFLGMRQNDWVALVLFTLACASIWYLIRGRRRHPAGPSAPNADPHPG